MENGTITKRLHSVFEDLTEAFGPMYVRGDFEAKVARLLRARTERQQILAELYDMFDQSGIAYEMNKPNSYYQKLVEGIRLPQQSQMEDRILREIFDRYRAYRTPEQYMERIVSKLEAPEDHRPGDTLRLRILRRFIRKGNYLADMTEIKIGKNGKQTLVRKAGGQSQIEDYITQKTGIKKPGKEKVLENLDDGVFDRLEQVMANAKITGGEKIAAATDAFRALCLEKWGLTVTAGQTGILTDGQKMKRVEADLHRQKTEGVLRQFAKAWLSLDAAAAAELEGLLEAADAAKKALRGKKNVAVGAVITAQREKTLEEALKALSGAVREKMGLCLTDELTELLLSKRKWNALLDSVREGDGEEAPLAEKWASMLETVTDAPAEQTLAMLESFSTNWNDPARESDRKELQKAMDAIRKARDYAHEIRQSATALDGSVGLLRLVDDLAGGMFREGGVTRRSLYLFAMVYDMPFYTGAPGTFRTEADLEKNLFRDYYSNNLMRYLSRDFREKLSETELDPSGMGINFKNFAEMVYLYYIAQRHLTAVEKIEKSTRMIQRLREGQRGAGRSANADLGTQVFRGRVMATPGAKELFVEDLLRQSEEEFETFLLENYDCNTQRGYTMGVLDLETEQNTAFENYRDILEMLKEELLDLGLEEGHELESCNYGLCFSDPGTYGKHSFEQGAGEKQMESFHSLLEEYNTRNGTERSEGYRTVAQRLGVGEEEAAGFMEILVGVNRILGRTVSESVSYQTVAEERNETGGQVIRALSVPNARRMTRSSMITAYYYYYNAAHERNREMELRSFRAFYQDFVWELDNYLMDSGYLPMDSKNIFDVLVAFSAYAYYNIG